LITSTAGMTSNAQVTITTGGLVEMNGADVRLYSGAVVDPLDLKFEVDGGTGNVFADGLITADNGFTTSTGNITISTSGNISTANGNISTTGTGDLVSNDDLTVADDATISGDLTVGEKLTFDRLVSPVATCLSNVDVGNAINNGGSVINYTSGLDDLNPTAWGAGGTDGQIIFVRVNAAQSVECDIEINSVSTFVRISGVWYQTSN